MSTNQFLNSKKVKFTNAIETKEAIFKIHIYNVNFSG
jgi:hypothetical protein